MPRRPRVLIACESSGALRRRFRAAGFDAWSCDLAPAEDGAGPSDGHVQADALQVAYHPERFTGAPGPWALLVAHPPCTYLASSGLHWNKRIPGREARTRQALAFVRALMNAPALRWAIENPVGRIGSAIRPADQYVHPHEFGDDASKRTGLWLQWLPPLVPTRHVPGRLVTLADGRQVRRWANQTDSGQNRLGPSPTRAADRSRTYPGIADAMVAQWGPLL